jgi:sugar phosphate isomerase/epimerase
MPLEDQISLWNSTGMAQQLTKSYKGLFPFKLATTSYIYPDHLIPNVARLAPFFDEIELVLFESQGQDNLPEGEQIQALRDLRLQQGIDFNIHLPIDLYLGDEDEKVRTSGLSTIKKIVEATLCLNPSVYTLHLERKNQAGLEDWQRRLIRSMEEVSGWSIDPGRISIESLGYPFEWIEEIVRGFGFSICLDIGHILISGQDLELHFEKYLSRTSIIHFHGFEDGVDHLGIDRLTGPLLNLIIDRLRNFRGTVSIEVFSMDELKRSLGTLEEKWRKRQS